MWTTTGVANLRPNIYLFVLNSFNRSLDAMDRVTKRRGYAHRLDSQHILRTTSIMFIAIVIDQWPTIVVSQWLMMSLHFRRQCAFSSYAVLHCIDQHLSRSCSCRFLCDVSCCICKYMSPSLCISSNGQNLFSQRETLSSKLHVILIVTVAVHRASERIRIDTRLEE